MIYLKMVISSFISSIIILALGVWAYVKLESSMNTFAERQLLIEPSKFSYKMWKDMPVTMYQSFTFFNLTNWNQVKAVGQKPRFVEVGPYVYRTIWTKSDINFLDEEKLVTFAEKKQWIFQPHLSKGAEDDLIWTINTPLMTALALIQNAPVITRNIVSVILDGLGEGAFIKRSIRNLLFEGYSDLIVSVGPLFDRRFSNFNGKFAYLYNKNDSIDGTWTVSTGSDDLSSLNKITRFQSNIVNMTSLSSGQAPQGLNEVKPECGAAWSLEHATNGQLFAPFNQEAERLRLQQQLQQITAKRSRTVEQASRAEAVPVAPQPVLAAPPGRRFFSRSASHDQNRDHQHQQEPSPSQTPHSNRQPFANTQQLAQERGLLRDLGKYIFYPDLCRPLHLVPGKQEISTSNGIQALRYYIDPRVFMNSSQVASNKCFEMNPKPALANALAATINSVTGANVAMPSLVAGASSPFAMFIPPSNHHGDNGGGLFERSNGHPGSFLNNAFQGFGGANPDQQASGSNSAPVSRLGRVRQLFSNIVSQRMSAASPGSLLPSLAAGPAAMLMGGHFGANPTARNSPDEPAMVAHASQTRQTSPLNPSKLIDGVMHGPSSPPLQPPTPPVGASDRWITQFRFKWPRGVFSIGQCQLGAPIYASLPHFLDADEYYLEQVDGLKPNRSLHEFYVDVESTLHSVPVGAKARLQLNVATPELRFRNIPNAMIPVLWQEVTFDIDKPIATMLYWSFTMSSAIYKLISVLLLVVGAVSLLASLAGSLRQRRQRKRSNRIAETGSQRSESSGGSRREGRRSSWRPQVVPRVGEGAAATGGTLQLANQELVEEMRQSGVLNRAFSSCTVFNDRIGDPSACRRPGSGPGSASTIGCGPSGGSPKLPSSRASSQCELVSSLGTTVNCAGCLLACLRHSPGAHLAANNQAHDHLEGASDNSLVRQHLTMTTSDIDKATLSSRESNLDSCSSIYTQRSRSFK